MVNDRGNTRPEIIVQFFFFLFSIIFLLITIFQRDQYTILSHYVATSQIDNAGVPAFTPYVRTAQQPRGAPKQTGGRGRLGQKKKAKTNQKKHSKKEKDVSKACKAKMAHNLGVYLRTETRNTQKK